MSRRTTYEEVAVFYAAAWNRLIADSDLVDNFVGRSCTDEQLEWCHRSGEFIVACYNRNNFTSVCAAGMAFSPDCLLPHFPLLHFQRPVTATPRGLHAWFCHAFVVR